MQHRLVIVLRKVHVYLVVPLLGNLFTLTVIRIYPTLLVTIVATFTTQALSKCH